MPAGVIFDFHNTLVRADSMSAWLMQAAQEAGQADLPHDEIIPVLSSVWSRALARHPDGAWDLDASWHRRVFEEVLVLESPCSAPVASALYDAMPGHWVAGGGAVPLVTSLAAAGTRLALVSNVALDVRPRLEELGLLRFFDTIVLSFEVGLVKPDPRIFELAVAGLGVPASRCLMVGDSPASDGGASAAGICSVVVPVVDDRPQLGLVAELLATP